VTTNNEPVDEKYRDATGWQPTGMGISRVQSNEENCKGKECRRSGSIGLPMNGAWPTDGASETDTLNPDFALLRFTPHGFLG
jgi:hypothetical protein